jgi:hypothetical protein
MRVVLDVQKKIEMIDLNVISNTEYIPRQLLQQPSPELKQSPKLTKNAKRGGQKQPQPPPPPSIVLPESLVNSHGVPTPVQSFLEVCTRSMSLPRPSTNEGNVDRLPKFSRR